jgi:hypothetical protein
MISHMDWPIVVLGVVVSIVVFWKARQEARTKSSPPPTPTTSAERVNRHVAEALQSFRAPPWEGNGTPASDADRRRSKSANFKPGTLGLIRAMRWENDARFVRADDETYLVSEIVTAISNHLYVVLGAEGVKHQSWPVPDHILRAAREALPDHAGTYAAEHLAYLLVRAGTIDDFVQEHLHPWERLAFTWRKQGLTGEKISRLLQGHALVEPLPATRAQLDGWIADPITAMRMQHRILSALFGETRLVHASLRDSGYECRHDSLFEGLMASAAPPVAVEAVKQELVDSALTDIGAAIDLLQRPSPNPVPEDARVFQHQATWLVRFNFAGRAYRFPIESNGTWMEVAPVLEAADKFLADLGRPDRVFWFQRNRSDSGEWGTFITAPAVAFGEVAQQLRLPLQNWRDVR